jgi:hypothetical protein
VAETPVPPAQWGGLNYFLVNYIDQNGNSQVILVPTDSRNEATLRVTDALFAKGILSAEMVKRSDYPNVNSLKPLSGFEAPPDPAEVPIEQLGPGGQFGAFLSQLASLGTPAGQGASTAGQFLRRRFNPMQDLFMATEATTPVSQQIGAPEARFQDFLTARGGVGQMPGSSRDLFNRLATADIGAGGLGSPGFLEKLRAPTTESDAISARNLALEARNVSPFLNRFAPSAGQMLGEFASAGAPTASGGFLEFIRSRLGGF